MLLISYFGAHPEALCQLKPSILLVADATLNNNEENQRTFVVLSAEVEVPLKDTDRVVAVILEKNVATAVKFWRSLRTDSCFCVKAVRTEGISKISHSQELV